MNDPFVRMSASRCVVYKPNPNQHDVCVIRDVLWDFCICFFVLVQLQCLRKCIMKFACLIIARSEVQSQCLQMVPDASGSEFDEQAWSRLQLGCTISMIVSHKFNARMLPVRKPASSEKISASARCGIELFVSHKP